MLLGMSVLDRIRRGEISLVFRRWRKPTVRSGGTLKTAIGVLSILDVREVGAPGIPRADVVKAGFGTKAALLEALGVRDGRDRHKTARSLRGAVDGVRGG